MLDEEFGKAEIAINEITRKLKERTKLYDALEDLQDCLRALRRELERMELLNKNSGN